MTILYGLYQPDEGEILRRRRAGRDRLAVGEAIELGIGMVHQHFMLVPVMTVAENIVLGDEPRSGGGLLDMREARAAGARAVGALRARGRPRRA